MANLPISQLPNVNTSGVTPNDLVVVVNYDELTGTTKNITVTDLKSYVLSGSTFTGNTSGDCITDLYVSNLYGCSPITLNENIEVSDGFSIKAKNGGGKLNLRDGFDNIVSLTTDDNNFNEAWFYGDNSSSSFGFGSNYLEFGSDNISTYYGTIGNDRVTSFSYDGFRTVQTPFFSSTTINGVIFGNNTSSNFTSNLNNTGATIISSKNSTVNQNVINSVVIGGENITATTDNTVYVPNLNISNVGAGTPTTNLGIDSNGNVVSGTTSEYTYEIGQYVSTEGGVIAHRWLSDTSLGSPTKGSIQNYLVVDTTNLSTSATWGLSGTDVTNCESTWDGLTNTTSMISAGAAVGTAAVLCDNSTNNGKSDWYLPAIDELNTILNNRFSISQGITSASGTQLEFQAYWSSTELNSSNSYILSFGNFYPIANTTKLSSYYVRAVRKFSI